MDILCLCDVLKAEFPVCDKETGAHKMCFITFDLLSTMKFIGLKISITKGM